MKSFANYDRGPGRPDRDGDGEGRPGSAVVTGAELRAALGLGRPCVDQQGQERHRRDPDQVRHADVRAGPARLTGHHDAGGNHQKFPVGAIYRTNAAALTVWLRGAIDNDTRRWTDPTACSACPPPRSACRVRGRRPRRGILSRTAASTARTARCPRALGRGPGRVPGPRRARRSRLPHLAGRRGGQGSSATFEHGSITAPAAGCSIS